MSTTSATSAHLVVGDDRQIARSFGYCHRVTRARARNFYYGLKLTPEPKRSALYAVYAWMRAADDLADEDGDLDLKQRRLEAFGQLTTAALDPHAPLADDSPHAPMWPAVRKTLLQYHIPIEDLLAMIEGQLLDQQQARYATFEQLYDYCYKVAGVVGLVCVRVWGYQGGRATRDLAVRRGIAFQLTNILRDLVEDARRGRVYLPADELDQFGYTLASLRAGKADDAFDRLMAFQIERARGYYRQAAALEEQLDPACRPTSWAMMQIYRGLLEKIARNPRRVLAHRVRLSRLEKLTIALRATWRRNTGK